MEHGSQSRQAAHQNPSGGWSATILQANLPLAVYRLDINHIPETASVGVVLFPSGIRGTPHPRCVFPIDAATDYRINFGSRCGPAVFNCSGTTPESFNVSGSCEDIGIHSGDAWTSEYYPWWYDCDGIQIQVASCYFK